jgi:hemolysin III
MGWLIVVACQPLARAMPMQGIALLVAGGVVYTVGIAFFALSKRVTHMHGVWHLCVLGGSIFHYAAVVRYVALA